jgi:hypothetical protein
MMESGRKTVDSLSERYRQRRAELLPRLTAFKRGEQPYLIVRPAPMSVYQNCNTIEDVYRENLKFFDLQLRFKSDSLPYLEPWMGTGIYANAFGCEYLWRQGDSPAVHYRFQTIAEITELPEIRIEDSPIMARVLSAIAYFREETRDLLPIALTDTQSANDTATLVLNATEVFTGCYTEPEVMHRFLQAINNLIIKFSRAQMEAIGTAPLARPGHIMVSDPGWSGMSISDDNLAVVSPEIGRKFCLKYDQELADVFGGIAIHSCGRWQHLMPDVSRMRSVVQVDCAIHRDKDPNPNDPEIVRDAFAGSGIPVKVRGPAAPEAWYEILTRTVHPNLRLIVQLTESDDTEKAAQEYDALNRFLANLYKL